MKNRIKQILRCYSLGIGIRSIGSMFSVSRNTVRRYVRTYQDCGIPLDRLLSMSDEHLRDIFFGSTDRVHAPTSRELELDELLPGYAKRLGQKGVTKVALYEEYRRGHPDGYSRAAFCCHLRRHMMQTRVMGHVEHKAADQMYVDYAGDKLEVTDALTGEIRKVEVFVAILPYSHCTFCEAVWSQRKEDFIRACEDALIFFGGVPNAIVPDNLKAAVTRPDRTESVINDDFSAFADHYGCAVYPARVRHPKDKALVENAVRLMYRSVYADISGREYRSIEALNEAISDSIRRFNAKKMSGRSHSRTELFEEVEKGYLQPLPPLRFRMKEHKTATVRANSYVSLMKHHYSVPIEFIGKQVELVYDGDTVEIYCGLHLVTTHARDDTPYAYTRKPAHRLPGHQGSYEQELEEIFSRAAATDNMLLEYLKAVSSERRYPPLAFRSCHGIMALESKYGMERLIRACAIAMQGRLFRYRDVLDILRTGQDRELSPEPEDTGTCVNPIHRNIRGREYFNTKKNNNQNKNRNNGKV